MSLSLFIQANTKEVSKTKKELKTLTFDVNLNETKIIKIETHRWYVICKDGERYEFETNSDNFNTALRAGNALCAAMEKEKALTEN